VGEILAPWFQLGYVIPHLYTDLDAYQFYKVAPDGAMLVTTQLNLAEYELAAVERELPTFWERIDLLGTRPVDVISLSGVPIASVLGRRRVLELLDGVSQRTGKPASTDLEAHIEALQHLGVEKLAVASRWPMPVIEALTAYLREVGIEVVAVRARSRNLAGNKDANPLGEHDLALELGREVLRAAPEAQGVILPGGLWFAIHAGPILEAEFGVPVTLNITATVWSALRRYPGPLPRRPDPSWGRLLASL
jgi:maleate cis-trans isomerase